MDTFVKMKGSFLIIVVLMTIATGAIIWNQRSLEEVFHETLMSTQIEQHLLECRRQEKNFIIRRDTQSIRLFDMAQDSLRKFIQTTKSETTDEQIRSVLNDLTQSQNLYADLFAELTSHSDSIAQSAALEAAYIEPLAGEARRMHEKIALLREYSIDTFQTKKSRVSLFNLGIFIISVFLAVIFAGILSDNLRDQIVPSEGVSEDQQST